MWITKFKSYKTFLKAHIETFPKKGYGQAKKLADHLGISPMVLSHILSRERDFTPDQAVRVASHFGLNPKETEYFLNLVYMERAESDTLRKMHEGRLEQMRKESENIKEVIHEREELTEPEKATFYSNWYFCGAWVLSSIKGYQTVSAIAEYFGLKRTKVGEIVAFLLETGICVQEDGLIKPGKKSIHVSRTSEFFNNHRRNWHEKATEKFTAGNDEDLFFSAPVSVSKKDRAEIKKEVLALIKSFSSRVAHSPEEKPMCLNIDWFEF